MSPRAACKCVVCVRARSAPPAPSPGASFLQVTPRQDLCPRGCCRSCRGSFAKLEGKGRGGVAPLPRIPGSAPKLVLQVQRPLLPRSSQPARALGGGNPPRGLVRGLLILIPQLGGCTPARKPPGRWVGGCRGARLSGQGAAEAEARLAGRRESLAAVAPSRGAHVTAVCFGRGSCRGQCKGVTPERAGAGVRGETRNERGAGGRGWWLQGPGQSGPVTATLAAPKPAIARREGRPGPGGQEMRDKGGGASLGEAGLEVAPPSSEGPQRMLEGDWEDRSDAGTTWRTFLAHSS